MKKNFLILTLIGLFFLPNPVFSQLKSVTLDECIGIAIQNHPQIKASDEDSNIAYANYGVAKSTGSPRVDLSVRTVQPQLVNEAGDVVIDENAKIGLYVGPVFYYALYNPQRSDITNAAKLGIDISKMRAFKTKAEIILNVKKNFYEYLFAREDRAKREELVKKFESKLEKARLLFKNGQRPILDVTKSDADLADARLAFEKSKNFENIVKSELLASMGITNEDIEFSPAKIYKLPELRFNLKRLYQLAENNNPDMKIARMTKELNQLNVQAARSEHYPFVYFNGGLGIVNSSLFGWENPFRNSEKYRDRFAWKNWERAVIFEISAAVNLWSGGSINAKTDSRIAEYNKSKYVEREILINARTLIKNYYQTIHEYKKQAELTELVIANSKKHLDYAQKSYNNGISTQLELQDAELSLLKSQLSRIRVEYDYLITIARLSNIVGLGEEYLCIK